MSYPTSYLEELRGNWRALAAATIGLGSGLQLNMYVVSIFGPHLLAQFGWTRSSFALLGAAPLILLLCLPVIGRLTDVFGVKRVASFGVAALPLSFFALSASTGDIRLYAAIFLLQMAVAATTGTAVYTRLVAGAFTRMRGLALAIAASGPAVIGAAGAPLLSDFVDAYGWRAGYQALGAFCFVVGLVALAMIPKNLVTEPRFRKERRRASQDYPLIVRSTAFWLVAFGMFLCNLPLTLFTHQLKLLLLENGIGVSDAGPMLSAFAVGIILGRFVSGLALDRMSTHVVASLCMGVPGLGMLLIGSSFDAPLALTLAVLAAGFSQGAEGDLMAFVVVRYFGIEIYGSVLGLLTALLSASTACGALLLSLTLELTDSFTLFVFVGAFTTVLGGGLLFLLGRTPPASREAPRSEPLPALDARETA